MSVTNFDSSNVPAIPIFTHHVNSSESLILLKNKNNAITIITIQMPTHTYECFIIENGLFMITLIYMVKNDKNCTELTVFFKESQELFH